MKSTIKKIGQNQNATSPTKRRPVIYTPPTKVNGGSTKIVNKNIATTPKVKSITVIKNQGGGRR